MIDFKRDADGHIVADPTVEYAVGKIADSSVFVALVTASSPQEFAEGGTVTQIALTPDQALEIAAEMKKYAQFLLAQKPETPVN